MPEAQPPRAPRCHTSTAQWQSFEIRMRRRRVDRCILRAETALEAGFPEDARLALAEARQLDPYGPPLDELEARIEAAAANPPVSASATRNRLLVAAAAALMLVIASALILLPRPGSRNPAERGSQEGAAVAPLVAEAGPALTRRPVVGVKEEFVTPEIVTSDVTTAPPVPESADPPGRPEPAPPVATPPAARAEPLPPQPAPLTGRALAARESAVPAAAPPETPPVDVPTRAAARPAPIEPVATATTGVTPAPREPAAEPAVDPAIENVSRIRSVLSRYEAAYSGLDAAAARAVWPAVDERALARAFNSLQSQRISLAQCDVSVDGSSARAECQGSASWVPKVGGSGRTEARRWTFDLRQAGGGWQIVRAEAR
jgi:hypothetical protein